MATADTNPETPKPPKVHKHRSPSYPGIGLKDAIAKAAILHKHENHHFAPLESLSAHWDVKQTNSSFLVGVSALKQFALLEEQGAGDSRQLRVTELALDIFTYEHEPAKRLGLIRTAALKPPIHLELWNKYGGKLPSDPSIKAYLVRERESSKFNKDHVDAFIAQFRETLAFAKLTGDDTIDPEDKSGGMGGKPFSSDAFVFFPAPKPKTSTPAGGGGKPKQNVTPTMRDLPITLPSLQVAVLRVPFPMTETDYVALKGSLAAFEAALVAKSGDGSGNAADEPEGDEQDDGE